MIQLVLWNASISICNLRLERNYLEKRAAIIDKLRVFFASRDILEVQTPLLADAPVTDPYLEALTTEVNGQKNYLQTDLHGWL